MTKNIIFTIALLSLFFIAKSQESLSISDAVSLGLQRNYDIQIEKANVEIASNNNSLGQAGRWPSISFSVSQNNNITDNVLTPNPFALLGQIHNNSLSPAVNMNWLLFDGFRVSMSKRRLEQLEAESVGNVSIVISNTIQSIILGYYLAVLEKQRLDEFQKQMKLSRDKYNYLVTKSEFGAAVMSEQLLEEGNYLTDSVGFINQQLAYRTAQRNLNVILAEKDTDILYVLTDTLGHEPTQFQYNDLRAKMFDDNVDLQRQYITQSILKSNIGLVTADRYPSVALNAGASHNMGRNDLSRTSLGDRQRDSLALNPNAAFVPDYLGPLRSTTNNYFANFTLSFTLFNGGRINRAIKNAVIQEDIGNMRIDYIKTSLERDLQTAFDQYQIRTQLYGINQRRVEAARINLNISRERFENGSVNSFDYRVVQNNYLSASIQELQALYNLIDSKVELMRLTGGIIETYNQ
ncbi:MAG: outer membrane protein [Cyclobacteriaceae bacterium]|jgi:outer membrane protein